MLVDLKVRGEVIDQVEVQDLRVIEGHYNSLHVSLLCKGGNGYFGKVFNTTMSAFYKTLVETWTIELGNNMYRW